MTQDDTTRLSPERIQKMVVAALTRKLAEERKKIERVLRGLLLALQHEEDLTRNAIADRLRDVEESIESLARELVRRRIRNRPERSNE